MVMEEMECFLDFAGSKWMMILLLHCCCENTLTKGKRREEKVDLAYRVQSTVEGS